VKKNLTYWSVPIDRVDEEERIVEGYAFVNETVPGEGGMRLKRTAMEGATGDYMKWGAIREMHQPSAAGTALSVEWDEKGARIRAKVVDDQAWKKVTERVYKAFSIGVMPTVVRGKDVEQCMWAETSLVDRPKDQDATLDVFRFDMPELIEIKPIDFSRVSDFVMERGKFADVADREKKHTLRSAAFSWLQGILLWPSKNPDMTEVRGALAEFAQFWESNGLCEVYKRLEDGSVDRGQTADTVPSRENLEGSEKKKKKCRECGSKDVVDDDESVEELRADFPLMERLATAESSLDKERERAEALQVRVAELEAKPLRQRPVLFTGEALKRSFANQRAEKEGESVDELQREMNDMFTRAKSVTDPVEQTRMYKRVTEIKALLNERGIVA